MTEKTQVRMWQEDEAMARAKTAQLIKEQVELFMKNMNKALETSDNERAELFARMIGHVTN